VGIVVVTGTVVVIGAVVVMTVVVIDVQGGSRQTHSQSTVLST